MITDIIRERSLMFLFRDVMLKIPVHTAVIVSSLASYHLA